MKIYLLDNKPRITEFWEYYFRDCPEVTVVCDDFLHFMDTTDVECVVSPANSYGLMDGGYDLAITRWFGQELMKKVQDHIIKNYYGEQPVGTSFLIDTGVKDIKLIHTPTMRIPSMIIDTMVVYNCMRSTLIEAKKHNIKSIVIPAFGGCCGSVPFDDLTRLMYEAYKQIMNPPTEISWEYAERRHPEWSWKN